MTHRLKRNPPPAPTRLSSLLVIGALLASCAAKVADATGQVIRVIDGDTIRLIGVDTPRTKHPTQAVEYFGRETRAFTKARLKGKTVRL